MYCFYYHHIKPQTIACEHLSHAVGWWNRALFMPILTLRFSAMCLLHGQIRVSLLIRGVWEGVPRSGSTIIISSVARTKIKLYPLAFCPDICQVWLVGSIKRRPDLLHCYIICLDTYHCLYITQLCNLRPIQLRITARNDYRSRDLNGA